MGWIYWLAALAIVVIVVVLVSFLKHFNMGYRFGKGMFKSSEYNLDEKPEVSDMTYFEDKELFD